MAGCCLNQCSIIKQLFMTASTPSLSDMVLSYLLAEENTGSTYRQCQPLKNKRAASSHYFTVDNTALFRLVASQTNFELRKLQ